MQKFRSEVFPVEEIGIGGTTEQIVKGGRDKFELLKSGFAGIKPIDGKRQISVIGWGSQGPAQAQNLRDSLAGTDIIVKVGLQAGSKSVDKVKEAGFNGGKGTLGEMYETINGSSLSILLISDAAQVECYEKVASALRPGTVLGLSHGFLLGHLESIGRQGMPFHDHHSVIAVCPKGMGPSVRRLYEQGRDVNGAGINCSFAVERDLDGWATDMALAWAVAIGAPYIFQTTLQNEYRSDIFGERGVLLGGVHGMVEALYQHYASLAGLKHEAFCDSVEQVTGVLSSIISKRGLIGVYQTIGKVHGELGERIFAKALRSAYYPYYWLLREIYDEVASGNEIRSVVMAGDRLKECPMGKIDGTEMWRIGEEVRAGRKERVARGEAEFTDYSIHPKTAGVYAAMMLAQINVLLEKGHCMSEVCNETVIEAVDSLNPYMHARGVAYMVDNCSTTARLGTRKWAPRFDHITMQQIIPALDDGKPVDGIWLDQVLNHTIHGALATCATMRPSVDISVV